MADWQVGDWALCVSHEAIECDCGCCVYIAATAPPKGSISAVTSVGLEHADCGQPFVYLTLETGDEALTRRFIKVTPDAADAFDREVIAALTPAQQEVGHE